MELDDTRISFLDQNEAQNDSHSDQKNEIDCEQQNKKLKNSGGDDKNGVQCFALRHVVRKPSKFAKKKVREHKREITWLRILITAGLTLFDTISDLILAVNYHINGHKWWGVLTLIFFTQPFILGVIWFTRIAFGMVWISMRKKGWKRRRSIYKLWLYWKAFECIMEAGPQLILQLYIMALPAESGSLPDSHNTTYNQNITGENTLNRSQNINVVFLIAFWFNAHLTYLQ